MDFKKYLTKEHIEKVSKDSEFPNMDFIEFLIHDYKVFYELLRLNKDFVLKGGAAAQLYIPLKEQRASIDIDLITHMSNRETKEVMSKLQAREYTPKKAAKDLPLNTYIIDIESAINRNQPRQIKVDILHENLENYKIWRIKEIELFILKIDFELPIIAKGSLIADKLLTLAKESVGIRDKEKLKEVPKQIYDLIKLCKELTIEDLKEMGTEAAYKESLDLVYPIIEMMDNGILLDEKKLGNWSRKTKKKLDNLNKELKTIANLPEAFNPNSGPDLRYFLFAIEPSK